MGYFNIFYKISRLIDIFTRKRNRKFIIALLIIALIFVFKSGIVKADFGTIDSNNLNLIQQNVYNIRTEVGSIETYVSNYLPNMYTQLYSMASDVDTISNYAVYIQTQYNELVAIYNQLDSMKATLESVESIDSDIYDEVVALNSEINDLLSKTDTMIIELNNIYDKLVDINTNIMHYGNLQHDDMEELRQLLNEYFYGLDDQTSIDVQDATINNMCASVNGIFSQISGWQTYYFKLDNGYTYDVTFYNDDETKTLNGVRYGYTNNVPSIGYRYLTQVYMTGNHTQKNLSVTKNSGNYFYISFVPNDNGNLTFDINGYLSNVNDSLTNIDQQVLEQGEETRAVITSTDYNQSDVSINTDSVSNIDSSQTDGLFTTIFNNFNSAATGGVDSISIPLPHNSGNIVLYSNVVSSHLGNLSALVSAFWYFVFGLYAFKFVNNLLHSIKDGSILDGFKHNNEVITSDML